jgi:hypothetical protein
MSFYGFNHTYGIGARNNNGRKIGTVVTFERRQDRDAWANASNKWDSDP